MAENDNMNQDQQGGDPFGHPIRRNNWWLYILGGLCFGGLIAWFFIDWSYKDRHDTPEEELPTEKQIEKATKDADVVLPQDSVVLQNGETLPQVTVEAEEPAN